MASHDMGPHPLRNALTACPSWDHNGMRLTSAYVNLCRTARRYGWNGRSPVVAFAVRRLAEYGR